MKTTSARQQSLPQAVLLALGLGLFHPGAVLSQVARPTAVETHPTTPTTLERRYQVDESLAYTMRGVNAGHLGTIRYEARARGRVKKNPSGGFVEELGWSDVRVNDQALALTPSSQEFREHLSLAPEYLLSVPDLTQVQPILIGPITDLLAFYADVQLAMRQKTLVYGGDRAYVQHGLPNSWADGSNVLVGQDAIDFDLTLQSIDEAAQVASIIVRHVPPAEPKIKWPVDWMRAPVSDSANNWVEVEKRSDGKYTAEVGKETFEADIKLALPTGRILSASMDNSVDVLARECIDAALRACGDPVRYRIRRQITLEADGQATLPAAAK
jgi:hypothetical protein